MTDQKNRKEGVNEASGDKFETRRRLLKASAAAPLIATLSPGSAMAQDSVSCDEKPQDFAPVMPVDDTALRAFANLYQHRNKPWKKFYNVGDPTHLINGRNEPQWFKVDEYRGIVRQIEDPSNRDVFQKYDDHGTVFVLCYIDVQRDIDGQVTGVAISGVYPQPEGSVIGDAISDSCMESIAAGVTTTLLNG